MSDTCAKPRRMLLVVAVSAAGGAALLGCPREQLVGKMATPPDGTEHEAPQAIVNVHDATSTTADGWPHRE